MKFIGDLIEPFIHVEPEVKRFEKQIKGNKFILDFYEFNVKSDKIIPFVNSCQVVLVMFDLNNRNSFDSLSDCWLSFLRDDCFYQNEIYILGNYETRNSAPLTQTDEINEMIKFSSLAGNEVGNSLNVNYIEVGNKTKNEMNLLIDELIFNTYEDELKNEKADDGDKGHSFKVEKCVIY